MAGKGEGSRGGKVIGHTRSGLPIYQSAKFIGGAAVAAAATVAAVKLHSAKAIKFVKTVRPDLSYVDFKAVDRFAIEAKKGKRLVGAISFSPKGKSLYVDDVFVSREFQRRGIGKKLMGKVIKEAQKKNKTEVTGHLVSQEGVKLRSKFDSKFQILGNPATKEEAFNHLDYNLPTSHKVEVSTRVPESFLKQLKSKISSVKKSNLPAVLKPNLPAVQKPIAQDPILVKVTRTYAPGISKQAKETADKMMDLAEQGKLSMAFDEYDTLTGKIKHVDPFVFNGFTSNRTVKKVASSQLQIEHKKDSFMKKIFNRARGK